mgnify:CR=1 FL=1
MAQDVLNLQIQETKFSVHTDSHDVQNQLVVSKSVVLADFCSRYPKVRITALNLILKIVDVAELHPTARTSNVSISSADVRDTGVKHQWTGAKRENVSTELSMPMDTRLTVRYFNAYSDILDTELECSNKIWVEKCEKHDLHNWTGCFHLNKPGTDANCLVLLATSK